MQLHSAWVRPRLLTFWKLPSLSPKMHRLWVPLFFTRGHGISKNPSSWLIKESHLSTGSFHWACCWEKVQSGPWAVGDLSG